MEVKGRGQEVRGGLGSAGRTLGNNLVPSLRSIDVEAEVQGRVASCPFSGFLFPVSPGPVFLASFSGGTNLCKAPTVRHPQPGALHTCSLS